MNAVHWIAANLPAWNSGLATLLYWLPLALCAYGYSLRGVRALRAERALRAAHETDATRFYAPSLTLGDLLAYALLVVMPAANLYAAVFKVLPDLLPGIFRALWAVLDLPLVPKRDRKPQAGGA